MDKLKQMLGGRYEDLYQITGNDFLATGGTIC